jgi:hypothetical protein
VVPEAFEAVLAAPRPQAVRHITRLEVGIDAAASASQTPQCYLLLLYELQDLVTTTHAAAAAHTRTVACDCFAPLRSG